VRFWYRKLTSTLVVGFTSKPRPPPKPMTFRCRLPLPSVLVVPAGGMGPPNAGVNSSLPDERFSRRPMLLVPNFLPHMRSNDSNALVFGSAAEGSTPGAGLVLASPWPNSGVSSRRWSDQVPQRPSHRLPITKPTPRSEVRERVPVLLPSSP